MGEPLQEFRSVIRQSSKSRYNYLGTLALSNPIAEPAILHSKVY